MGFSVACTDGELSTDGVAVVDGEVEGRGASGGALLVHPAINDDVAKSETQSANCDRRRQWMMENIVGILWPMFVKNSTSVNPARPKNER